MITLGGVTISDDMYLEGVIKATPFHIESQRSVDGVSFSRAYPTLGGREFTLGSTRVGALQGIWCQSVLDSIKTLQNSGTSMTLDYHGAIYVVFITSMKNLTQMFSFEPVTPEKKYTGAINLTEV